MGMEVADAPDHGRSSNDLVAVIGHRPHQFGVLTVAAHQLVSRMTIVLLGDFAVFGEIVYANNLMSPAEKFIDDIAAQKAG